MEQEVVLDVKVKNQGLKQQLKEATDQAKALQQHFGATSTEAINAAKKVAAIKDEIDNSNKAFQLFDPKKRFENISSAVSGIASGFQAVTGAIALFGTESEDVEKALLKVQAASAFAEGLNSIKGLGDAFTNFKLIAVDAFKAIKGAISSTGIGLLLVAVGTLVAYWDDIKEAVSGVSEEQKKLLSDQQKSTKQAEDKLDFLEKQDNILKEQGKTEKEILQMKIVASDEAIKGLEAQLLTQEQIKQSQIETAERNKVILQNIIRLISAPLTTMLAGIDLAGKAFGKNFGLEEKFSGGIAKLMFDPETIKKEADKGIEETKKKLNELKNQRAGFNLSIKQIDDEAAKKAKDDAKKHQEELLKEEEEFRKKRHELISASVDDERSKLMDSYQTELSDIQKQYAKKAKQREELENLLALKYEKLFADLAEKQRKQAEEEAAKDRQKQRELLQKNYEEKQAFDLGLLDIELQNLKTKGELTTDEEIRIENEKFSLLKSNKDLSYLELQKIEADHAEKIKGINEKAAEDAIKKEKEKEAAKKAIQDEAFALSKQALDSMSTIMDMNKQKEIEDAKGNKDKIAAIEKKYFERNKKLQIAQATMATAQAAVQAYQSMVGIPVAGPALGAIAAAAAVAAGALQIAKIKSTTFEGGGGSETSTTTSPTPSATTTSGGVTGMQAPQQVGQSLTNANAINNALNNPNMVRAVVVETDITDSQRRVRGIEDRATFG